MVVDILSFGTRCTQAIICHYRLSPLFPHNEYTQLLARVLRSGSGIHSYTFSGHSQCSLSMNVHSEMKVCHCAEDHILLCDVVSAARQCC